MQLIQRHRQHVIKFSASGKSSDISDGDMLIQFRHSVQHFCD